MDYVEKVKQLSARNPLFDVIYLKAREDLAKKKILNPKQEFEIALEENEVRSRMCPVFELDLQDIFYKFNVSFIKRNNDRYLLEEINLDSVLKAREVCNKFLEQNTYLIENKVLEKDSEYRDFKIKQLTKNCLEDTTETLWDKLAELRDILVVGSQKNLLYLGHYENICKYLINKYIEGYRVKWETKVEFSTSSCNSISKEDEDIIYLNCLKNYLLNKPNYQDFLNPEFNKLQSSLREGSLSEDDFNRLKSTLLGNTEFLFSNNVPKKYEPIINFYSNLQTRRDRFTGVFKYSTEEIKTACLFARYYISLLSNENILSMKTEVLQNSVSNIVKVQAFDEDFIRSYCYDFLQPLEKYGIIDEAKFRKILEGFKMIYSEKGDKDTIKVKVEKDVKGIPLYTIDKTTEKLKDFGGAIDGDTSDKK